MGARPGQQGGLPDREGRRKKLIDLAAHLCGEKEYIDALPGNRDVYTVFQLGGSQLRTGVQGFSARGFIHISTSYIGFDFNTLFGIADRLHIRQGPSFLRKLRFLEGRVIKILGELAAGTRCTEQEKEKCRFEYGAYFQWTCDHCEKNPDRIRENGQT